MTASPGTADQTAEPAGPARPAFVETLSRAHYAHLARCVVLSGNVDDVFPIDGEAGPRWVGLDGLLRETFAHARYPGTGAPVRFIVLTLKSDGIGFASPADRAELVDLVERLGPRDDQVRADLETFLRAAAGERASSLVTLSLLAELLRIVSRIRARGVPVRPVAIVVHHAEAILPAGDIARLAPLDREAAKVFADLLRDDEIWAEAETADVYPDLLILVSPTAAELSTRVASLPRTVRIDVPIPDEAARGRFVRARVARFQGGFRGLAEDYPLERLVVDSKGLTLRALDDLLTAAHRDPDSGRLDRDTLVAVVNGLLQERLGTIIKLVYPDHTMADVVGFRALRKRLTALNRRFDDPERAPAGITVVGPNGAGKTFILEAFARDTGRTVVTLSQIRSEWYGKTDVFAEMFEAGVESFGRILIVVDEAHVAFGSIHSRDTHETEARLARHIIQMMDDLENRSRVVWALITTRPDLLDPDFVRSGRCSLFVPIFDPEGDDAKDFVGLMERRLAKAGVALTADERALLEERSAGFSAGDYREFADDFAEERSFATDRPLAEFLEGWTPSSIALGRPRELQILLAALRCEWPELLPERFKGVSKEAIQLVIDRLQALPA